MVVILIGSSASVVDISGDIAGVAKEVHVASRSVADQTLGKLPGYENIWPHSMVKALITVRVSNFEIIKGLQLWSIHLRSHSSAVVSSVCQLNVYEELPQPLEALKAKMDCFHMPVRFSKSAMLENVKAGRTEGYMLLYIPEIPGKGKLLYVSVPKRYVSCMSMISLSHDILVKKLCIGDPCCLDDIDPLEADESDWKLDLFQLLPSDLPISSSTGLLKQHAEHLKDNFNECDHKVGKHTHRHTMKTINNASNGFTLDSLEEKPRDVVA
ncbi:hypothetical protein RJ641_035360 [Dillenia turbinata]|uniref:Uncharacterized protein n=1 Tax=Dillenia turbinata TaxID=194707 RepID=A0AAN8ZI67_9MAGN